MPEWRKRKRGTPRQIGQAFPLRDESQQQKKGLLPKIVGRIKGDPSREREKTKELYEKLKNALRPKEDKMLLDDEIGIFSPEDMEYLQAKGLIEIDEYSGDISLTTKGISYIYKKRIQTHPEELDKDGSIKLTDKEREWMRRKLEEEA